MKILGWYVTREAPQPFEAAFVAAIQGREKAEDLAARMESRRNDAELLTQKYRDHLTWLRETLMLVDGLLSTDQREIAQVQLRAAILRATPDGRRPFGGFGK